MAKKILKATDLLGRTVKRISLDTQNGATYYVIHFKGGGSIQVNVDELFDTYGNHIEHDID